MKVLCTCFCLVCSVMLMGQTETVYKSVSIPPGYRALIDVVYVKIKEWEGKVDLYLPSASSPSPLVINIHGGGWNHGVKESQSGFNSFFKQAYAVANIEYRLTGQATAPAAIEDVRCALIFLINNATEYHLDVEKIILVGGSAGGHLALMAGLLGNDRKFDRNCPCEKDIKVAAIIDKYGITDVWDWGYGSQITSKSATNWLGDKMKDQLFAKSVSPIHYINQTSPPIFIVHGDADPTVPLEHSLSLHKKLIEYGVHTELHIVKNGGHGKFTKEESSTLNDNIIKFIKNL